MPLVGDRRAVLAVVGNAGAIEPALAAAARAVGHAAVAAGFRLVTGGGDGVMAAASLGARCAPGYREGDVLAILPGERHDAANPYADIVIPTGLGVARNVLVVASADVVVAVGGGAGTLSEIAIAAQLGRPLVALLGVGGWSHELAGRSLDARRGLAPVRSADTPEAAVALALAALAEPPSGAVPAPR